MIETRRLKSFVIFFQTILSFVLSRNIKNIYNDIAQKQGNVTVKHFQKYEKLKYKQNNLKLDLCIPNSLFLNCSMFQIKMLYKYVKIFSQRHQ